MRVDISAHRFDFVLPLKKGFEQSHKRPLAKNSTL